MREQIAPFQFKNRQDLSLLQIVKENKGENGDVYSGFIDAINQCREYKGIIVLESGAVLESSFSKGFPSGIGRMITSNLDVIEGNYISGKLFGKGAIAYNNGGYFEGDFLNNKKHGQGRELFSDGRLYTGEFSNDFLHGKGKIVYPSLNPNESSTLPFHNGEIIEGTWVNSNLEGPALLTSNGNLPIETKWKSGQRISN
eukprot:TRINITY_DN14727_c0_g1_i1.p1 TRINITY_DN14727_c0_g1~~TRINITY_DN14727_c0_g1_i1.p1  ORF type:complete len:199 (+),score=25.47 TRINITY_DN14727_c0_g1_i1:185-781(+)